MPPKKKNVTTTNTAAEVENLITPDAAVAPVVENESNIDSILEQITSSVDEMLETSPAVSNDVQPEQKIELEELIPCKSITYADMFWISPVTNSRYYWRKFGSVAYLPFKELVALYNTKQQYMTKPLIVIQDARVVRHFRLTDVYEKVAQIHNFEVVLTKSIKEISKVLDDVLNVGMRDIVVSKAREMVHGGTLTNIKVIKLLEDRLRYDLGEEAESVSDQ